MSNLPEQQPPKNESDCEKERLDFESAENIVSEMINAKQSRKQSYYPRFENENVLSLLHGLLGAEIKSSIKHNSGAMLLEYKTIYDDKGIKYSEIYKESDDIKPDSIWFSFYY